MLLLNHIKQLHYYLKVNICIFIPEGFQVKKNNQFTLIIAVFFFALFSFLLGGCSAHKPIKSSSRLPEAKQTADNAKLVDNAFDLEAEFEDSPGTSQFDPLSGYNRFMTQINDRVYFWALKPVAQGYSAIIPEPGRLAVGRFFRNLLMPIRFTNNLLQFKTRQALTELARFTINSTIGVLGFADPAKKHFDLPPYPEDFGQTLGHYGVGSGFHLVLPLLGPSNLRDTIGLIPDHFLDPAIYVNDWEVRLTFRSLKTVNQTSLRIGEYESIKKDAVDLYPFLRDAYEQRRDKLIQE
jgi:phospholipid-binding lipoprotein MlaA